MGKSSGLRAIAIALCFSFALGCATRYRIETLETSSDAFHKERIRVLAGLQKKPTDASLLLQAGIAFARMGQHRVALNYLDRANQAAPKNVEVLIYRADSAQQLGLRMSAWQDYQRILELDPTKKARIRKSYAKLLRSVVDRFRRYRQYERAIEVIEQLRALQGLQPEDRKALAEVYFERARRRIRPFSKDAEQLKKALVDFRRADELGLRTLELQLWLGMAHLAGSRGDLANQRFDRFTGAPHESLERVERLIGLLRNYGHRDVAIARLSQYLARNPLAPARLHQDLGNLYLAAGRTKDALATYELWLTRAAKVDRTRLALKLASTFLQKQMYREAAVLLRKSVELAPDDAAPFRLLLIYAKQQGPPSTSQKMQALLDDLVAKHPRQGWVRATVGELYRQLGDNVSARVLFEKALQAKPPYVDALLGLARLHQLAGARVKRDEAILRYLAAKNRDARAYRGAGDLLLELQEPDDAMKLFRTGMRARGDIQPMLLRAYVLRLDGQFDKEREEIKQFLEKVASGKRSAALLGVARYHLELHDYVPALAYLAKLVESARDDNARTAHLLLGDLYAVPPLRNATRAARHYRGYMALVRNDKRRKLEALCARLDGKAGLEPLQAELYEMLAQYHKDKKAYYLSLGRRFLDRRDGAQALLFMKRYLKLAGGNADERIRVAAMFSAAKLSRYGLQLIRDLPRRQLLEKITSPSMHRELGDHFRQKGRTSDAEAHYRRYLAGADPDPDEMYRLGNTLASSSLCDLAVYAYRLSGVDTKGLQKGIVPPEREERAGNRTRYSGSLHQMFMGLGRCYVTISKPDRAETAFDAALATHYRSYYYYSSIGGIFFRANYLKKALKYYERLYTQKYGSSRYVYRTILDIYVRTGLTSRIPKLVSAYLERHRRSRHFRPHRDMARMLADFGQLDRAIAIIETAREKNPQDGEYVLALGEFYLRHGQVAKGLALYRTLLDASTWRSTGAQRFAEHALRTLMQRGLFREAVTLADEVLKAQPSESRWLLIRGTLYARLGDAEKARRDIADAFASPQMFTLSSQISSIISEFRNMKRLDLAIQLLNHVRLLNPKRPLYLRDLAQLYEENGQIEDAKQTYLEYVRLDKNALVAAARFFRRIGDIDRARRLLLKTFDVPRMRQESEVLSDLHDIYHSLGRAKELDGVITQYILSRRKKDAAYKVVVRYYQKFPDPEKLQKAMEQLRKYEPYDSRMYRAQQLLAQGKFDQAMPLLRSLVLRGEAPSVQPYGYLSRYTRYRYWRRRIYFSFGLSKTQQIVALVASYGRLDLARELARLAVRTSPTSSRFVNQLIEIELRLNHRFEAIEIARRFLNRTVSASDSRSVIETLNRHGLQRESAALLADALKRKKSSTHDDHWSQQLAALRLALANHDKPRARTLHRELMSYDGSQRSKKWLELAYVYATLDVPDLAWEVARRLLNKGAPSHARSAYQIGLTALVRLGRTDELERWSERFVSRNEDRLNALLTASRSLAQNHRPQAALRYGYLALKMRPQHGATIAILIHAALMLPDEQGRRELEQISKSAPNTFRFWSDVLTASWKRHRQSHLVDAALRHLRQQPGDARQLLFVGANALFFGELKTAKANFKAYIARHSSKGRAHYEVGTAYLKNTYLDLAQQHLRESLKARPGNLDAQTALFRVALARRNVGEALEVAKLAVGDVSAPSAALENLVGAILEEYPSPPSALLRGLARLVKVSPGSTAQLVLESLRIGESGDAKRFGQALDRLARAGRSGGIWVRGLALHFLRDKHISVGLAALERFLAGGTSRVERASRLRASIAMILLSLRLNAETLNETERSALRTRGLALLESLRGADRKPETLTVTQASIYEHGGLPAKAIWLFRRAILQHPTSSVYYNNLAYLFARRGYHLDEAIRLVRKASAIDPAKRMYYDDTEGWVRFKMGRVEDARRLILGSMRIVDERMQLAEMVEYYYHLALIELKLEKRSAAIWRLRQAAHADPYGIYGLRAKAMLAKMLGLIQIRDKP